MDGSTGHLPDWVVEDNESLCSNLLERLAGDRSAPPTNPATSPEPAKQDDGQAAEGAVAPPIQQHDGSVRACIASSARHVGVGAAGCVCCRLLLRLRRGGRASG